VSFGDLGSSVVKIMLFFFIYKSRQSLAGAELIGYWELIAAGI